mmetsp:Transcript_21014/g.29423  ORF Transcript_21014/g.29423 Transcript_21014/m.29423 type:complete len:84 (-) Transcript_21014:189-440(-)
MLTKAKLECVHFGGTMAKLLPNHPPPAASKFDQDYLYKVMPRGFDITAAEGGGLKLPPRTENSERKNLKKHKKKKKGRARPTR